jgi:hypothetical protein
MRRFASLLLVAFLVAACSSAPSRVSRAPGSSSTASAANRTFATPSGFPNFVDHSVGREEISIQAMSLVGVPYRWGGNTPEAGFDCSGLVRYVVDRAASVNLPRTTADMSSRGDSIEPDEVAPGDLIFFNTTGRPHSHVGIYVGKLRFVNAPSTGGTVRLDYLTNPYWAKRFDGIRRVAAPRTTPFDTPTYLASPGIGPQETRLAQPPIGVAVAARAPAELTEAPASRVTQADAFEPPPQAMPAAQQQAQAAGAVTPRLVADGANVSANSTVQDAFEPPPSSLATAQRQQATIAAASRSTDPIGAVADAFEPPPPTARLAAQQARASSATRIPAADTSVQVMRASTQSVAMPRAANAPNPANAADPIARFANGSY